MKILRNLRGRIVFFKRLATFFTLGLQICRSHSS